MSEFLCVEILLIAVNSLCIKLNTRIERILEMKIVIWYCSILILINCHIFADDSLVNGEKVLLTLEDTSQISVNAFIAPIEMTINNFHLEWDALANLRANEPEKQHPTTVFQAFLPDKPVSVGELWKVNAEGILPLLQQLLPKPKYSMHIDSGDSYGLLACLRAYNDKYADIVFRIHAEFELKDGRFTPSQFKGHLILDRMEKKVAFFNMYVPDGVINFDVGWKKYKDRDYSIIDSGVCTQMELRSGTQDILENIQFEESITQQAAELTLAHRFYSFYQINWVPLDDALRLAQEQEKPIHVISIDGPMNDEAC